MIDFNTLSCSTWFVAILILPTPQYTTCVMYTACIIPGMSIFDFNLLVHLIAFIWWWWEPFFSAFDVFVVDVWRWYSYSWHPLIFSSIRDHCFFFIFATLSAFYWRRSNKVLQYFLSVVSVCFHAFVRGWSQE